MKKVLFATTALVLTAGVASAEVTFSGSAGAGVAKTKGTDMEVWSGIGLDVAASATTDSGMTVSVAEDFGGGSLADYDDDYAIEPQTSDLDTPTIVVSMGATTICSNHRHASGDRLSRVTERVFGADVDSMRNRR